MDFHAKKKTFPIEKIYELSNSGRNKKEESLSYIG